MKLEVSDRAWVLNIRSSATKFSDFKHIVGKLEFLRADYYTKIFCFVSTGELQTLYIQELPYMNTFCECILKKIGLTHEHFQYNSRKLVNVVKSPFYYDVFFEKIK